MSDVKIGRMMIGSYQTNCYFLFREETKKAIVIDPADNGNLIYDKLTQNGFCVEAILLTHGHFDHVGAIIELIEHWDVPVYAHPLEIPFLTGEQDYPKPDSTVGGGLVARMSPMFPNDGISLGSYIKPLPEDGSVPNFDG